MEKRLQLGLQQETKKKMVSTKKAEVKLDMETQPEVETERKEYQLEDVTVRCDRTKMVWMITINGREEAFTEAIITDVKFEVNRDSAVKFYGCGGEYHGYSGVAKGKMIVGNKVINAPDSSFKRVSFVPKAGLFYLKDRIKGGCQCPECMGQRAVITGAEALHLGKDCIGSVKNPTNKGQ